MFLISSWKAGWYWLACETWNWSGIRHPWQEGLKIVHPQKVWFKYVYVILFPQKVWFNYFNYSKWSIKVLPLVSKKTCTLRTLVHTCSSLQFWIFLLFLFWHVHTFFTHIGVSLSASLGGPRQDSLKHWGRPRFLRARHKISSTMLDRYVLATSSDSQLHPQQVMEPK